jgi:DNA primase
MSLPRELQERVDRAKQRVSLDGLIGRHVKLRKAGREMVGLCPFHSETTPSLTVASEKGFYHCFGCGSHGDALAFLMQLRGVDFAAALAELEGGEGAAPVRAAAPARHERARPSPFLSSTEAGQIVWSEARPVGPRDLPARWLAARGIDPLQSGVLEVLRFHPACPVSPWRKGSDQRGHCAPAMLAPLCRVHGSPGARVIEQVGLHLTFLSADGARKAELPEWTDRDGEVHRRASRQMWGEAARCAFGIPARDADAGWIDAAGPLVVAEGLESTLSLLARTPGARGAFATLSLGNLQGGWLNDGPGSCLKLWQPTPDEARPPFLVRAPGAVVIGVDADMKGLKDRVVQERPRAKPVRRDLSGAERAGLCGALAQAHWRSVGASPVRLVRPKMGRDFNDLDRSAA